jgi:hypothetical protein
VSIVIAIVCVGIGNIIALTAGLSALHRRLDEILAKRDGATVASLHEAATSKTALLATGIQSYHERMVQSLRTQLTDADVYARVLERRAQETAGDVDAAGALVQRLKEMVDRLAEEAAGLRSLRAPPEPRRPPPALEAPGGAKPLPPPEAANVAAGLGPRPTSSVRLPAVSKRKTLLGIPTPAVEPVAEEGDRPSAEDLTKVMERPSPEMLHAGKTLPSMQAVSSGDGQSRR